MENKKETNINNELKMYFSPTVAERFAALEQNDKNIRVAQIVDRILMSETAEMKAPLRVAELGGGAHPDRYHEFFRKLLTEPRGKIEWIDISPYMLQLAEKYLQDEKYAERKKVIEFVTADMLEYLEGLPDESLDVAIMKYTIDYVQDIELLFQLLKSKLKPGGRLISTIGNLSPELKSFSTNARFLYNGEAFPDNETRTLIDGDRFTVKFFNVSGDRHSGFLEGAETMKYFYSAEKFRELAEKYGFEMHLGDWKDAIDADKRGGEEMDQDVLILRKKERQ